MTEIDPQGISQKAISDLSAGRDLIIGNVTQIIHSPLPERFKSEVIAAKLPDRVTEIFGREKALNSLDELFLEQTEPLPIVLLTGMAGVGKSELASHYGYSKLEDFKGGVGYFPAAKFGEELRDFMQARFCNAKDLRQFGQLTSQVTEGWKEWQEFCENLSVQGLIIVDDVTDYHTQVTPYLPRSAEGKLPFRVVLTAQKQWSDLAHLAVEELDLGSALEMLTYFVGENQVCLTGNLATAESICERLGCLPLALALVGSWLSVKDAGRTLGKLIEQLEAQGLESEPLNEQDPYLRRKVTERVVNAAFWVSWETLNEDKSGAQQLARVLSLFAVADVPWELVEWVVESYPVQLPLEKPLRRRWWGRFWDWLRGLFGYRPVPKIKPEKPFVPIRDLEEARRALCRSSLLKKVKQKEVQQEEVKQEEATQEEIQQEDRYRLHGLLHEFFGARWAEADRLGWEMAFVEGLSDGAREIPGDIGWEKAQQWQPMRPHFEMAQNVAQGLLETTDHALLYQRYKDQKFALEAGAFRLNQVPIFARTFQRAKEDHGKAKAALALGQQNEARSFFSKAKAGYEAAIKQGEKALPENSLTLAGYLIEISKLLSEIGLYREAIPPATKAVNIAELKANPVTLAYYLNNLAVCHYHQGNFAIAEPLSRRSLDIREKQLGADHPSTATSLNNLALLYGSQGKYSEAEPLYRRSLDIREKQLGADHPDTASSLNNLAALYRSQGRDSEAEPLYRRSLDIREKQLGADHPDTASSLNNLALLYESQGKYSEAEPLFRRSLDISEKQLGADHPDTAISLNNLALLYESQGKYSEAEPLYRRSLDIKEKQLGADHPDTATSLFNLAVLYHQTQRPDEALSAIQRAISIYTQTLGIDHPEAQAALSWLEPIQKAR